jgi:hypothetical protein
MVPTVMMALLRMVTAKLPSSQALGKLVKMGSSGGPSGFRPNWALDFSELNTSTTRGAKAKNASPMRIT